LGLPAFVLNKVFAPGFFAREDTKTPMVFAMINALINIILSYILFFRIGVVGIAVATSVAGWVNTGLLIARLWQQGHYRPDKRLLSKAPRLFLASLLMGGALFALANWLPGLDLNKVLTLALLVLSGMISYAVLVQLVGGARIQDLKAAFRKN
jgi:putative peptidoglycan lipid II flippase